MTTDKTRPVGVSLDTGEACVVCDSAVRLQREFDGTSNAETIERYIYDSQRQLTSRATGRAPDVLSEIRDDVRARVEALMASLGVRP